MHQCGSPRSSRLGCEGPEKAQRALLRHAAEPGVVAITE